jgi:hypothetical protein
MIHVHPRCQHVADEMRLMSYRVDRLTGNVLPDLKPGHDHTIDSLRYSLQPIVRGRANSTFFSYRSLMADGEPLEPSVEHRAWQIIVTIAVSERVGTAVGLIFWGVNRHFSWPMRLLDYDLAEIDVALSAAWIANVLERARNLRTEWHAVHPEIAFHCEEGPFYESFRDLIYEQATRVVHPNQPDFHLYGVGGRALGEPTLDARAAAIRPLVNGGQLAKLARSAYTREITHRGVKGNALVSQILGFRTGAREQPTELVHALVLGVRVVAGPPEF